MQKSARTVISVIFLLVMIGVLSPSNVFSKEILYTLCDDQIYLSLDGGSSWDGLYIESDINLHYNAMEFDIAHQIMYIASGTGVLRSTDSGKSWDKYYPSGRQDSINVFTLAADDPSIIYTVTPTSLYISKNRGISWTPRTLPSRDIYFIKAFIGNSTIYAAGNKKIFKSTDNGNTWKSINSDLSQYARIWDMAVNPHRSNEVYLSTTVGLYRSVDGGKKWWRKDVTTKEWIKTTQVVFYPPEPSIMYMLSADEKEGGVCYLRKSTDGGNRWITIGSKDEIRTFAVNPCNADRVFYLGYSTLETGGAEGLFRNIYKSENGGRSWSELQGILPGTENIKKMYVRPW